MKELELNDTYIHFNGLIWQVPSWGIAIAAAVIVAATQVGKDSSAWFICANYVQASILCFGFFLLSALTIALYRYRAFQAACAPDPVPVPPFRRNPPANLFLQGALCLTTGGLGGLALAQAISKIWPIFLGIIIGVLSWIIAEVNNKKVVKEINEMRQANIGVQGTAQTPRRS